MEILIYYEVIFFDKAEGEMTMKNYCPEGYLLNTAANRAAMAGVSSLRDAARQETVLEARAGLCDREHNLHVDLGVMKGVIPRDEGALGIAEGTVRDIALISRVGKPVCFTVTAIRKNEQDKYYAVLSRRRAQQKCMEEYVELLSPGDILDVTVTHIESFGVFCDVGAGVSALLPIDFISVSRIPHPSARFFVGQSIKAAVYGRDEAGRITLTHKELLGTWRQNAELFSVGETVPGVVRSVESYGVFVELTPNLAGLAEYNPEVKEGQAAAVYIKNIIPERMKVKLVIVDHRDEEQKIPPLRYFAEGDRIDYFRYSPEECARVVETVFG